jgi:hypothetical protein
MNPNMPSRWVIDHEYVGACRYTGYQPKSIRLKLECGHKVVRKASAGVPRRAQCPECAWAARLRSIDPLGDRRHEEV